MLAWIRGAGTPRSVLLALLVAAPAAAQPSLRERMLVAEDQRAPGDADLATLRQGLGSSDAAIRRQAVRAIGRLERPELISLVSRLLTDPNADVRAETVNAIGQLARGAEGLAAATSRLLVRAKAEPTPRVRGVVAATLGRLAYTTASDVQQVERVIAQMLPAAGTERTIAVNLDEIAGAAEGLEALIRQSGKISPPTPATIDRLRAASAMRGRAQDADVLARIRRLSLAALVAAGRVDGPLLQEGLDDADEEVRRLTMIAARAEIEGPDGILQKGLADANPRVRYEALQTWGRALQTRSCAPVLAAIRDQNPHVMLLAIDLLGNGCPEQDSPVSATLRRVAQALTSLDRQVGAMDGITASGTTWHAPAHALVALAKVAPADARPLLPLFVSHPIWQVRMYAAIAAGRLAAFDELENLGRAGNENIREAALGELVTAKRPEAIQLALDGLTHSDYQLVITASRALAVPAATERGVAALLKALQRITEEQRDTSRDPRMAILERLDAIGWYDGTGAAPANLAESLRPYLRDFDPAIANKTAEILQKWTQKPVAAAPQPLPRSPARLADIEALRGQRLRFVMRGKGSFELRLLMDEAPWSALRVATRAREGYYNGLSFHRVVPNFVIQGGSPGANEYMGDGPFMRDEVGLVSHRRGTVGISTRGRDTGDAQIFVNLVDLPRLDHTYTVFAEVVAGMDVVDLIVEGDVIERVEVTP